MQNNILEWFRKREKQEADFITGSAALENQNCFKSTTTLRFGSVFTAVLL